MFTRSIRDVTLRVLSISFEPQWAVLTAAILDNIKLSQIWKDRRSSGHRDTPTPLNAATERADLILTPPLIMSNFNQ